MFNQDDNFLEGTLCRVVIIPKIWSAPNNSYLLLKRVLLADSRDVVPVIIIIIIAVVYVIFFGRVRNVCWNYGTLLLQLGLCTICILLHFVVDYLPDMVAHDSSFHKLKELERQKTGWCRNSWLQCIGAAVGDFSNWVWGVLPALTWTVRQVCRSSCGRGLTSLPSKYRILVFAYLVPIRNVTRFFCGVPTECLALMLKKCFHLLAYCH